jgi:glycosyltransferase involved in cell wall biosynthesis
VWGAVETYAEQILTGLDEDAVVIAPAGPVLDRLSAVAEVRAVDDTRPQRVVFGELVRHLRQVRPRLVHVVDAWPLAMLAARTARTPRLIVTHHTPALPRADGRVGRLLWSLGWLTRPEVIYTSESDRAQDGRKGVVIPLGVDLARFNVERRPEGIVGTVARLAPQKGLDTLIDAVPLVTAVAPGTRFVIVGDGPQRAELERRTSGLPVEFLGSRDDVPQQLARFDVFALPSRFEGLCLAVIEAQAAGVPVVATPVGGIVETVVDGETGLLVPVDDAPALARAITELLLHPDRGTQLATTARERARARFSVQAMLDQTLTFYALEK